MKKSRYSSLNLQRQVVPSQQQSLRKSTSNLKREKRISHVPPRSKIHFRPGASFSTCSLNRQTNLYRGRRTTWCLRQPHLNRFLDRKITKNLNSPKSPNYPRKSGIRHASNQSATPRYIYSKKHGIKSQMSYFYSSISKEARHDPYFFGPSLEDLAVSEPPNQLQNHNKFRCVFPYMEMMLTYFKQAQHNRNLLAELHRMFPMAGVPLPRKNNRRQTPAHFEDDYWYRAMENGNVLVAKGGCGKPASSGGNAWFNYTRAGFHRCDDSYHIQEGDGFYHMYHRHEAPVSSEPLQILSRDVHSSILPVYKPASIPIHPVGPYKFNSMISLLCLEEEICPWTFHRIDRIVSGLVLVALDSQTASKASKAFLERQVKKEYLAQVQGKFPDQISSDSAIVPGRQNVGRSGGLQSYMSQVSPAGKSSFTSFTRLGYDLQRDTSLVLCCPSTGRSHQIRIHLSELGFPILGDPLYHPEEAAKLKAQESESLILWTSRKEDRLVNPALKIEQFSRQHSVKDPECHVCEGDPFIYPSVRDAIDLHAYRYELFGQQFSAPPPPWATQSFHW